MRGKPVGVVHPAHAAAGRGAAPEPDSALAAAEAEAWAALDASWLEEQQRIQSSRPAHIDHRPAPARQDADWEQDATCHYLRDDAGILQTRPANKNEITGARDTRGDVRARHNTGVEHNWEDEQRTTDFARSLEVQRPMLPGLIELSRLLEAEEAPTTTLPRNDVSDAPARAVKAPSARRLPPPPVPRRTQSVAQPRPQPSFPPLPPVATPARQPQPRARRVSPPASLAPELRNGFEAEPRTSLRPGRSPWLWSLSAALPICALLGTYAFLSVRRAQSPVLVSAVSAPTVLETPPETGFTLHSTPPGAQISIDGKLIDRTTPARVAQLVPGSHSVELSLSGYVTANVAAVSRAGEVIELPNVELQPSAVAAVDTPAPVTDASDPVAIGQTVGVSGAHVARARRGAARRAPVTTHARRILAPIEATPVDDADNHVAELTSDTGVLQINSRPWSRVLVDGGFVGNTPQRALKLEPGRHTVRLVNQEFSMSKSIEVTIAAGQTIKRVETLDEDAVPTDL